MGEMARTLVFTGEKQIEIQEYPIPEVSDDMVLVKTDACAICTWAVSYTHLLGLASSKSAGGRALNCLGGVKAYQNISNSECQPDD